MLEVHQGDQQEVLHLIEDHLLEVAITMNPHHQDHREEVIMVVVEILIHTHRVA